MIKKCTSFEIQGIFLFVFLISNFMRFTSLGLATIVPAVGAIVIYLLCKERRVSELFVILVFLILATIHALYTQITLKGIFKVLACVLAYYGCLYFGSRYRDNIELKIVTIFKAIFVYLFIEMVCRVFFGDYFRVTSYNYSFVSVEDLMESGGFYAYKTGSPFFLDSNFTGLFILPFIYLFSLAKHKLPRVVSNFIFISIATFIILTFSRTMWVVIVLYLLFFIFHNYINLRSILVLMPIVILFMLISVEMTYNLIGDDGSFATKVEIWSVLLEKASNQSYWDFLLGHGFEIGKYVYSFKEGVTAHALIPQMMGEVGLIGTLLYLVVVFLTLKDTKEGLIFYFALLLAGFSLFDPWDPVTFSVIGLANGLYVLNKNSFRKV